MCAAQKAVGHVTQRMELESLTRWLDRKYKYTEANPAGARKIETQTSGTSRTGRAPISAYAARSLLPICVRTDPHVAQKCTEHSHVPDGISASSAHTAW